MGKLYVVSTPIGNLGDMTFRGIEILKEVDLILSEDTRETDKILQKWNIKTPQISYREENHERIMPKILESLAKGDTLALVSDSGTPVISDPGFRLVRELRNANTPIISIPGPSAGIAALSVSGLPSDNFIFLGFLPKKSSQRTQILLKYGTLPATMVIYESPYRVKKLLKEVQESLGNRTVCLAKDLTKRYEDVKVGKLEKILEEKDKIKEKGEYVILVSKKGYDL